LIASSNLVVNLHRKVAGLVTRKKAIHIDGRARLCGSMGSNPQQFFVSAGGC
jgi:hypothetical protein